MNKITLTYIKKTSNKYTLLTNVNGEIIGDRDYTGTKQDHELYSKFVEYLQIQINKELEENPEFIFKNIDEFRAYANSSVQREFLAYLDSQK